MIGLAREGFGGEHTINAKKTTGGNLSEKRRRTLFENAFLNRVFQFWEMSGAEPRVLFAVHTSSSQVFLTSRSPPRVCLCAFGLGLLGYLVLCCVVVLCGELE